MYEKKHQIMSADVVNSENHLLLAYTTVGALIPIGPGQAMPIPGGVEIIPMSKEGAIEHANAILEAAEALPDEQQKKGPDILLANNMNDVANVARQTEQFRGPRGS